MIEFIFGVIAFGAAYAFLWATLTVGGDKTWKDRHEKALLWQGCARPPKGWWCSRKEGHEGPCAARREPK